MITNYQCPNCQNLFSEQDYRLHSKYCKAPKIQYSTNQFYNTIPTTKNNNYLNTYTTYDTTNNIPVYTTNLNTNTITNRQPANITSNNTNQYINLNGNTNVFIPQQTQPITEIKTYFRPQTITYFNSPQATQNQVYDYSNLYQNQVTTYPTNNNNSFYKCNICGKTIPFKE